VGVWPQVGDQAAIFPAAKHHTYASQAKYGGHRAILTANIYFPVNNI